MSRTAGDTTDAQTEARAIAQRLQDVVDGTDGWLNVDKAAGIIATALSRTGTVKVDRQRLNTEISRWATDSDLHITIGDVEALHEAILSALEPAASEGHKAASAASVDPDGIWERAYAETAGVHREAVAGWRDAEALSRTGAVKVKALEWEERKTRLGTVWWSAPNPLGGLSIEAASENDKIAAQADYERRVLSALEPAAPEGHHPDDIAVDRFAAAMKEKLARKREEGRGGWDDKEKCSGEYLSRLLREHVDKGDPVDVGNLAMMLHQRGERIAPEGQQPVAHVIRKGFSSGVLGWTGYGQKADLPDGTMLYTRPTEQAVTEAMVDAAEEAFFKTDDHGEPSYDMRAALKAAMGAGR